MKPLILTSWLLPDFMESDVADLTFVPYFKFVWGQLPSTDELAALFDLIEELPSASKGLGATEKRMLELVGRGYSSTKALFHHRHLRQTSIFDEWQHGYLPDGLSFGPVPVVTGLDDELRTRSRENYNDRLSAYHRSRLSLTDFGKAVLAHREDFSRHNPVDRWSGGTHLTNDCLWRYDPVLTAPAKR